jgi:glycopeptide antibiotics resistance protein
MMEIMKYNTIKVYRRAEGEIMRNHRMVFIILLIICVALFIWLFQSGLTAIINENSNKSTNSLNQNQKIKISPFHIAGSNTYLIFDANEPVVPATLPLYQGKIGPDDSIDLLLGNQKISGTNIITEEDAPDAARRVLDQYGGLPSDAILSGTKTNYIYTHNSSSGKIIKTTPTDTTVFYDRKINGLPVVGLSDRIIVEFGENGKVLWVYKYWRTLEYTGNNISIIPLNAAIDKLRDNEIFEKPQGLRDVIIQNISLGYYEKNRTDPEVLFEPVWIFKGTTSSIFPYIDKSAGASVTLIVSAQQSSDFSSAPTERSVEQTVYFTKSSDALLSPETQINKEPL